MGLTIHFDKVVPDTLEQWLSTEARYIIGTFSKPADLQKIFGANANKIIAECKQISENVVGSITMVLTGDLQKLYSTAVRLQNGEVFLVNDRYSVVENAEAKKEAITLIEEDGPRVYRVTNK